MKKKVFVGLALTLFVCLIAGCSLGIFGGGGLSPPSWIRGTWSDTTGLYRFKFTSNNIQQYMFDRLQIDFSSSVYTVKEQEKTGSVYEVDLKSPNGTSTYTFEKNGTALDFTVSTSYGIGSTTTLYKE